MYDAAARGRRSPSLACHMSLRCRAATSWATTRGALTSNTAERLDSTSPSTECAPVFARNCNSRDHNPNRKCRSDLHQRPKPMRGAAGREHSPVGGSSRATGAVISRRHLSPRRRPSLRSGAAGRQPGRADEPARTARGRPSGRSRSAGAEEVLDRFPTQLRALRPAQSASRRGETGASLHVGAPQHADIRRTMATI